MTWVRTEDSMPLHPKIIALSDGAFRLWENGLHFANRAVTDGKIAKSLLPSLNHHGRWTAKQMAGFVKELVGALWVENDDHFRIHDYEHHQAEAMKDRVERKRELDREKQRRKRERAEEAERLSLGMSPGDARSETTSGHGSNSRSRPVPSRPDQNASHSGAREAANDQPSREPFDALRGERIIAEAFSRHRQAAWLAKRGNPGGRYSRSTRDFTAMHEAVAFFADEADPVAALEDSLAGFMADSWAIGADWPFSSWAGAPGKFMGKVASAVAKSIADKIQAELAKVDAEIDRHRGKPEVHPLRKRREELLAELRRARAA